MGQILKTIYSLFCITDCIYTTLAKEWNERYEAILNHPEGITTDGLTSSSNRFASHDSEWEKKKEFQGKGKNVLGKDWKCLIA